MKVFFDTNVLIAAYISHGSCAELFDHCLEKHTVFSSHFVLEELREKLAGKLHLPEDKVTYACEHLGLHAVVVGESVLPETICRDADDDHVIAAAVQAHADCIVTGDKRFQALRRACGIPIVSPASFWEFESRLFPLDH